MMRRYPSMPLHRQRGAALFVSLILLLVLTLIGVTAAQMQTVEERMALNDDNHQLALQSGEAVVQDSEDQFDNGDYPPSQFNCSSGSCTLSDEVGPSGNGFSIADQSSTPTSFTGQGAFAYTGPPLAGVHVGTAYEGLERLPTVTLGGDSNGPASNQDGFTSLRTTTLASGADSTSNAVVQTVRYHALN